MILFQKIKHFVLLIIIVGMISVLAFTLEKSEFNDITRIDIKGNIHLSSEKYLSYAKLAELGGHEISTAIIRDRLSKHPYVKSVDVIREERGIVKINLNEKKVDAILLKKSKQFLITNTGEIIPFIFSTKNIDVPVIISNNAKEDIEVFTYASNYGKLYSALKIISTAEIYDPFLHKSISELNLFEDNISLQLMDFASPIFFGVDEEIEKTVYLSKLFKHMKLNKFNNYLEYVDLRFNELVYLGFDDQFTNDKESI